MLFVFEQSLAAAMPYRGMLHLFIFGFWIAANLHWVPGIPSWDESFVVLAMVASVEAIFLSTFVLITQNRMAAAADKRADLDLQISLLAEHEITKLTLVSTMADKLGVGTPVQRDLAEIQQDVAPEAVLEEIERKARIDRTATRAGHCSSHPIPLMDLGTRTAPQADIKSHSGKTA
jgi:uncharacterized membrane protein